MLQERYRTLIDPIVERARRAPEAHAITFVAEDGARQVLTAAGAHRDASLAGRVLAEHGVEPGRPTLLAMRYSRALLAAWCGAVYRGAVPSVLTYLTDRNDPAAYAARVRACVLEVAAQAVVTAPEVAEHLRPMVEPIGCVVIGSDRFTLDESTAPLAPVEPRGDDLAWLQFTSGTTAGAKGVAVSHAALLNHLDTYCAALPIASDDVMVSWLPLYHDMGLLTALVMPLLLEIPTVLMSPTYWVRNPVVLMRAMHEFRGTICNMPTFGYEHCTHSIRVRDMDGIDLRTWRRAGCGGEPVRHATFERFWHRFSPYGLRENVFVLGYGMAENVMTATTRHWPLWVEWIDRRALQAGRAVPAAAESSAALPVVSNGPPLDGTELRIVDAQGRALPERHVGEILVRSPHMMSGYYRRPDATAEVLRDGWLHSGDLGYLASGELFICGRKKDLIIVGGHNVHAEEVEVTVESVEGIQPGRVVAFGVADERLGTEQVIAVCELQAGLDDEEAQRIDRTLRRLVVEQHQVALGDLRFVSKGWIVKTSSGKLARAANRTKYLAEVGRAEQS